MWWKIYYWISIITAVLLIITLLIGPNSLIDLVEIADFILAVIGIYAFIYRKRLFNPSFWLCFFWFNLVLDIAYLAYGLAPNDPILKNLSFLSTNHTTFSPIVVVIFSLLNIPMLYAFYQLANPHKK